MSRHRDIRKLDIQDVLDDNALSDGGDLELTPEQEAAMSDGLQQVRRTIGSEDLSGLSDNSIKEMLWEYYFDVEKTIKWAAEEQQRRRTAKERKEPWGDRQPMLDEEDENNHSQYYPHGDSGHYVEDENVQDYSAVNTGPRLPSIFLAQQQPGFDNEAYLAVDSPRPLKKFLSTITERTERTEQPSTPYRSRQHHLIPNTTNSLMSSPTTSYGNELGDRMSGNWQDSYHHADPNTSRHSPSLSAIEHLNRFEPPPSNSSTSTITPNDQSCPYTTSESISSLDNIPTIPDLESKTSEPINRVLLATPPPNPPMQSKIAKLASSRASSIATLSSRSTGTAVTGSIKTFPNLRPSAQSERPPSSIASSKELPPLPPVSEILGRTTDSLDSSFVRMAIENALQLEVMDRENLNLSTPKRTLHRPVFAGSEATTDHPKTSTSTGMKSASEEKDISKLRTLNSGRPMSRQAKLAQERAESITTVSVTDSQSPASLPSPAQSATSRDSRPLSKLAILAQQKVDASKKPKLPKTTTEYLTPIANGSSVTTAITTSYHSLFSLTDPSKPSFIPKLNVVPLQTVPGSSPTDQKQSKLAMKIQRGKKPTSPGFPSEDEIVSSVLSPLFLPNSRAPAKERERALKQEQQRRASTPSGSRGATPVASPSKGQRKTTVAIGSSGSSTPLISATRKGTDQQELDFAGLNLADDGSHKQDTVEPPKMNLTREKVLEEAKLALKAEGEKKGISLVVIGHVDAGKSTLMGRLLYELGKLDEKTRRANEKGSEKMGKASFSWAWALDGTLEERERGITMDIAMQTLTTPNRIITVLDAPGHKDFIPKMISGASQADCALLVVDSATGAFEAGFDRGGQTREHLLLVRSLGVSQVIVAVNKLDQVEWSGARYEHVCSTLRPFLVQSGFQPSKTKFVPVGAVLGVNLVHRDGVEAAGLKRWYNGASLVDLLDKLAPPVRDLQSPLRLPISNVFKGQNSCAAVSGRLSGGIIQVGERLRVLPGDETTIVRSIEIEDTSVPWAASGSNVTVHLTSIDPVNLSIGSVLCPPSDLVRLVTVFTARIIVFDIQVPITSGASVEIFHHSRDVPATTVKLISTNDRTTGKVIKHNPRVLTKGVSAEVQIALRGAQVGGVASAIRGIPLEPFASNKDMGRILIRRGGETIAAGVVTEINA